MAFCFYVLGAVLLNEHLTHLSHRQRQKIREDLFDDFHWR